MGAKPAVQVIIAGDTKGLDKALKHSSGALQGFGKTALGVFGGIALAKGVGLAIDGIQKLGGFALGGVEKLDALGDATARLDTLAKGLGKTATAADLSRFGVDKGEQADSALAIAKTGKALGLTGKQVSKITPNLQEMAAQLASLGDGDPVKQAELLAKALAGNAKAAKALGIVLPKGAKGLDAYAAIAKQLGPQLDKATGGQASLADVGERWDATLANLQIQLGGMLDKLAPVISALLDSLLPALQTLVEDVGPLVADLFTGLSEALAGFLEDGGAQTVADIFGSIADVLGKLAAFIAENVVPIFLELAGAIGKELGPIMAELGPTIDAILPVLQTVFGFVADVIVPLLVTYVIPLIGALVRLFLAIAKAVAGPLNAALKGLGDVFQDVLDWIAPVLDALRTLGDLAGKGLGAIGDIVPWSTSAPASSRSGAPTAGLQSGGMHVTIQTGVGDPVAIGRAVARYLGSYQLRGGTV